MEDRCPVILCKVIDHLHRERNNMVREFGEECRDGLKKVVEELSKLRYEMQTSKPILPILDTRPSAEVWNSYLEIKKQEENSPSWFSTAWMWSECYMYRRMTQALTLASPFLQDLDFFRQQKEEGFHGSLSSMSLLAQWFLPAMERITDPALTWDTLVQVCLWGNKCDLSISSGCKKSASGDPVAALENLNSRIMVNQGSEAWSHLSNRGSTLDIVMDNSGFELFTDLCLADFLVTSNIVTLVRLRIKDQPWFVSDVTPRDFNWTIEQLVTSKDQYLAEIGSRWRNHLQQGRWSVHQDPFWTYPHTYRDMAMVDPDLYNTLSQADLIIFKGDLNYRKLVGDLNWETTVSLQTALQGFLPAPVLTLRTAKADVMVGLSAGQAEETAKLDPDWMVNGEWGVVQYAAPISNME